MEDHKYIYWHPGDEQPDDINGWLWYNTSSRTYCKRREPLGKPLNQYQHYRKAVPDAEYRAYYGMKLWHSVYPNSKIEDGYKVIDYRRPNHGKLFANCCGHAEKSDGTMLSFVPILEKIEPAWVTPTQQDVIDCIKATDDYPTVVFGRSAEELNGPDAPTGKLVYVEDWFIDSDGDCYNYCKMKARHREEEN